MRESNIQKKCIVCNFQSMLWKNMSGASFLLDISQHRSFCTLLNVCTIK